LVSGLYADVAIGLVDEIETPRFHHTRVTFADRAD
jgi:putative NADH-flavin reductase